MDEMLIITAPCWQCGKDMFVAVIGDKVGSLSRSPESFSDSERKLAEQHGVLIKYVQSKTAKETYLANTCKECGAFVGRWFLFADYYAEAIYGYLKYKNVKINDPQPHKYD
jgi:hypothetical protein